MTRKRIANLRSDAPRRKVPGSGRHAGQRRVNRGRGGDRNPILSGRQRQTGKAVGGDRTADVEPGHLIKRPNL